jgi:hypothetical protein
MLAQTGGFNLDHFTKQILRPLGCIAAQVTFTDLCAHHFTRSSHSEAFGGRFMSLHLVIASSLFASHNQTPLKKILRLFEQPQVIPVLQLSEDQ